MGYRHLLTYLLTYLHFLHAVLSLVVRMRRGAAKIWEEWHWLQATELHGESSWLAQTIRDDHKWDNKKK